MLVPGVRRSVLFLLPLLADAASAASHRGEPARARGAAWVGSVQPGFLKRREILAASAPASAILAASLLGRQVRYHPTLEATQRQMYGFFSQLPYKCHQNRVASVGD